MKLTDVISPEEVQRMAMSIAVEDQFDKTSVEEYAPIIRHLTEVIAVEHSLSPAAASAYFTGFMAAIAILDKVLDRMPALAGTFTKSDIDDAIGKALHTMGHEAAESGVPKSISAPYTLRTVSLIESHLGLKTHNRTISQLEEEFGRE